MLNHITFLYHYVSLNWRHSVLSYKGYALTGLLLEVCLDQRLVENPWSHCTFKTKVHKIHIQTFILIRWVVTPTQHKYQQCYLCVTPISWQRLHLFSLRSTLWTKFFPSAEKVGEKKHVMDVVHCNWNQVINSYTLIFCSIFSLTLEIIPEIIPTSTKGLVASTPNVTSSPVPGAFCDSALKEFESDQTIVCRVLKKNKVLLVANIYI